MAFNDLREFIAFLELHGQLQRVTAPVSADLEITEITDRVSKAGGPALLFENVRGYDMPVLINTFGSEERMRVPSPAARTTVRLERAVIRILETGEAKSRPALS